MRAWIWTAGLLAGLALGGQAHAQLMGTVGNSSPTGGTAAGSTAAASRPNPGLTSYLGQFRLSSFFPRFGSLLSTNGPVSYTTIPDPSTPAYLQAFGFKPLR
jgi:hypothetical protein